MAATTELGRRIELSLKEIRAEAEFLPDLAARWSVEPDLQRDSWQLEWRELMHRLEDLDQAYQGGRMSASQSEEYLSLLETLTSALPFIEALDLDRPSTILAGDRAQVANRSSQLS